MSWIQTHTHNLHPARVTGAREGWGLVLGMTSSFVLSTLECKVVMNEEKKKTCMNMRVGYCTTNLLTNIFMCVMVNGKDRDSSGQEDDKTCRIQK